MNATSIEPARPASEHLVSLSHHSYLIRSVSGSDELALFDMFARSSPEDLRLRCLGMIKDFPRLAAARLARCDRDREIALVAIDGEGRRQVRLSASRTSLRSPPSRAVPSLTSWCEPT